MAYSKVLNRPMFNKHNSAYGRGIASNLVSDEQRQRFNYGGRVGFDNGELVGSFEEQEKFRGLGDPWTLEEKFTDWYKVPEHYTSDPGALQFGTAEMFATPKKQRRHEYIEKSPEHFESEFEAWKKGTGKKWVKRKEKEDLIRKSVGEGPKEEVKEVLDLNLRPEATQTTDKYSDLLDWSPQEKQEKMGQMQLAMAERLIGGSRDKWGSTAQMKNLAGALGDVRKITDKEDIRKDQRKYRAAAEMYKDVEEHKLAQARTYENQVAGGASPIQALYSASGGKIQAKPLSANEKIRKKDAENLKEGDVVYDSQRSGFIIVGYPKLNEETVFDHTQVEEAVLKSKQKR